MAVLIIRLCCTVVLAEGTVAVAEQVVGEVSNVLVVAVGVIHRVLHVIHSGGKSSSIDGCGTLVQYW